MTNPRFAAVTVEHVNRAARTIQPGNIQKWGVMLEGTEYPVRPLMMAAANLVRSDAPLVTPADSNTHQCGRWLQRLGFEVRYHG